MVEIEELALTFRLTNKDTIRRLKDLEKNGMIKGVLDERGKYIYIEDDEI